MKPLLYLALLICPLAIIPAVVFSADSEKNYSVRAPTYKMLTRIHKLMDEEKYQQALDKIKHFTPRVERIPFENALLYQMKAYVYMSQSDYKHAVPALETALDGDYFPEETDNSLRLNLAQLYVHNKELDKAASLLEQWFKKHTKAPPEAYALAGHTQYLRKNYTQAETHLSYAIKTTKTPLESWYQLLLASYYELKKYSPAEKLLRTIVSLYPDKRNYWLQLSNIELHLNNNKLALASLELAEDKALLNQKDLIRLTNLKLHMESPHRGARLLQSAIDEKRIKISTKNLELLANAWVMAREYELALAALNKAIALSEKQQTRLVIRKAELLIQLERWQSAMQTLQRAHRTTSKSTNPKTTDSKKVQARSNLLLGVSAFYAENYPVSRTALKRAKQHKSTLQAADDWLQHLDQRERQLQQERLASKAET